MMLNDPYDIFSKLRDSYVRYYDSAFDLRDDLLSKERRSLLQTEGTIFREPYVEFVPRYESSKKTIAHGAIDLGLPRSVSDFIAQGLFPADRELYTHQWEVWDASWHKRNVIVTSGTGSGKTESFLIPIIARLVAESENWLPARTPANPRWWTTKKEWQPLREHEQRPAAIRALILYPMNALVEDQVQRLRRALDSSNARNWLDQNRAGNRFYFGRYTGRTKVPGRPGGSTRRLEEVRSYLAKQEATVRRILDAAQQAGTPAEQHSLLDTRFYIGDPAGAEMLTRWDMQQHPPDILITNYSMLNIMMMRDVEESIWEKTRAWLNASTDHIFTLVVDELHSYRGTTGTEVALILRNLCDRLGLWDRPQQLRIIAASASLNNDPSGETYASQFFGLPASTFEIISERRALPSVAPQDLSPYSAAFGTFLTSDGAPPDEASLVQALGVTKGPPDGILRHALESIAADASLLNASKDPANDQRKAQSFSTLASRVFSQVPDITTRQKAFGGLLRAIGQAASSHGEMLLPARIHYFFRTIQGLWACTNPTCTVVKPEYHSPDRPIGQIYFAPRVQCDCGGRVADVLYCQTCGELYLGGYKGIIDPHDANNNWAIVPDQPNLQDLPDKARHQRTSSSYTVYWPSKDTPAQETWTRSNRTDTKQKDEFQFRMTHAYWEPMTGTIHIARPGDEWTGWVYAANTRPGTDRDLLKQLPAFPIQCLRCGDDWEGDRSMPVISSDRTRSPIRTMRTGFEKINQVLGDALLRQMPDAYRKLVVFSDSRQDAAKLSAGLEKNHFTDVIRQVVVQAASKLKVQPALYLRYEKQEELTTDEEQMGLEYERLFPQDAEILRRSRRRNASADDLVKAREILASSEGPVALSVLRSEVERELLALGMNPAGPDPEFQWYQDGKVRTSWTELVDWSDLRNPKWQQPGQRSPIGDQHLQRISARALQEVIYMLFAHQRRDIESLGLGWCTFDPSIDLSSKAPGLDPDQLRQVCDATIRILADHNRTPKPPPIP
jgi:DEAD/DEAH box helicase domain-containing protein